MKNSNVHSSNSSGTPMTRRRFLCASALAATAFNVLPRHVLGAEGASPSEKLNIAGIGVGGMGANNLKAMAKENILALCDVDHEYAAKTFAEYPGAKLYKDYREMLEKEKQLAAQSLAKEQALAEKYHWRLRPCC